MFFKKRFKEVMKFTEEMCEDNSIIMLESIAIRVTEKGSEAVIKLVNTEVITLREGEKE